MKISTQKLFILHLLIWSLLELLVNPIGAFPLNDDWAYYQNVYYLSEEGRFFFSDWLAMTLILQVLWGALFCKIFGFSFTVLRLATVLLGITGTWCFYLFLKKYINNKIVAYGAALLLVVNPIYFSLANSFMTEVPFLSVFIPGLFCLANYLDRGFEKVNHFWWGGMLFGIMATMIRQPGLILPLAFGLVFLLKNRKMLVVKTWIIALLPLVLSFSLYKLYSIWLKSTQVDMPVYGEVGQLFRPLWNGSLAFKILSRHTDLLFYSGWFLLPLTIFLWKYYWTITTKLQKVVASFFSLLLASSFIFKFDSFPMGNMIGNFWLGPKTLFKDAGHQDVSEFVLSDATWLVVKCIGVLAGVLLLFELLLALFQHFRKKGWSISMLSIIVLGYYAFLILNPYYNDRYLLIFVPLLIPILLPAVNSFEVPLFAKIVSLFFFVILLFYSITGTHDYLSWNRTAWHISNTLEKEKGISPAQINGGFEYSSWYNNPTFLPMESKNNQDTTRYAVSFEPALCGWEVEKKQPYFQWMFLKDSYIYTHKKNSTDSTLFISSPAEKTSPKGNLYTSNSALFLTNRAPLDSTTVRSGQYAIRLSKEKPYSFSTELERSTPCFKITATVWRKREVNPDFPDKKYPSVLVVKTKDFNYHKNTIIKSQPDGWEQIRCQVQLYGHTDASKVNVYLWNNSGETQWFDDFTLQVEQ